MNAVAETAKRLAAAHWRVLPLKPGTKLPAIEQWQNAASDDAATVAGWWNLWPHANVGLLTGHNGVFVVDVDCKGGAPGFASLAALEAAHGALPATLSATTASGGCHLFFTADAHIRNSGGRLGAGLDVRGAGGFVVAAGSVLADGSMYRWDDSGAPIAEAPAWLIEAAAQASAPAKAPGNGDADGVTVEDAGTRHADLIALAVRLARSGVSQATAMAAVEAEHDRGRWSRDVPEGERAAAVSSAYAKIANGDISREVDPWAVGFGRTPLPAGAVAITDTTGPRFKLTPAGELVQTPKPLLWLVRDMLLPGTSSMLVGDPAAGKSLLVIDWSACVALGRDWLGRPVASGLVVYLAGEGHHGIARRLKAWSLAHLAELDTAALVVSDRGASLNDPASLQQVVEAIDAAAVTYGMPALVVVDTLHRNLAGDENSAADTAAYFHAVDVLRTRYGAHVLTVHHSGHASKDRGRGSSSLRAAVDTELLLGVAGEIRTLTVSKQKDGPTADPMHFQLQEIALPWLAADGEPETSVILAPSMAGPSRLRQLPPSLRLALDTLRDCGDGPVSLETWRTAFYERHPGDSQDAKKKAFRRARAELTELQQISVENDNYRITGQTGHGPGHAPQRPGPDRATPLKGGPLARVEASRGASDESVR